MNFLPSFNLRGVMFHWFSGPIELLPQMIERGYYVSEGPPTVYSSVIKDIVLRVPMANLLTETDGPVPYIEPFKDKLTTSAFIPQVVKSMAQIKKVEENDAANQFFMNFVRFFHLHKLKVKS
jgi:TatD DNase family protein